MKLYQPTNKNGLKAIVASRFFGFRKKNRVFIGYRKKITKSSCINFYKEVFKMEENEIKITEEMDKELSNGKEEGEE